MRDQAKPGIDWATLRTEFEQGMSLRELGRKHHITHKAIQKRRDKEGWSLEARLKAGAKELVATAGDRGTATPARTATAAEIALDSFRKGYPKATAAALAGIDPRTLDSWLEDDAVFAAHATEAKEAWHAQKLANIDKAGERGDWKADAYRLERNPDTRETYAQRSPGGTNLQIVLNVDRAAPDTPNVTIEGTKAS